MQLTGAERAAGIVFREDFRNAALLQKAGSALKNGSYIGQDGLVASTGWCELNIPFTATNDFSLLLRFTPDFDWDDGGTHYLFDTEVANRRLYIYKSSTNRIVVNIAGTTVMNEVGGGGTWSDSWVTDSENVFEIRLFSGLSKSWLNGTIIKSTATPFLTEYQIRSLIVGSSYAGAFELTGSIQEVIMIDHAIDDLDEPVLRNGTLISDILPDRSLITLPLERDYAIAGVQSTPLEGAHKAVLDHAIMGNGVSIGQFPTKLPGKKGYSFDGVNDYIQVADHVDLTMSDGVNDLPYVIAFKFMIRDISATRLLIGKGATATDCDWLIYVSGGTLIFITGDPVNSGYVYGSVSGLQEGQSYTGVFASDGSGTIAGHEIYLDGVASRSGGALVSYIKTAPSGYDLLVGVRDGITWDLDGEIQSSISLYKNLAASPMQAKALTHMIGGVQ